MADKCTIVHAHKQVVQTMTHVTHPEEYTMTTMWLSCFINPSQIPNEYSVSGKQYNGRDFSVLVPQEAVSTTSNEGIGLMKVEVVAQRDDLVLVRLPAQSLETGHHVTVDARTLR